MRKIIVLLMILSFCSCKKTKWIYKNIETERYLVSQYTFTSYGNNAYKNALIIVHKGSKDTVFISHKNDCVDFNLIKQDTLKIFVTNFIGDDENTIKLKDGLVIVFEKTKYNSKKNIPFRD